MDNETAWAAGLFEGEGCAYMRTAGHRVVSLTLGMTDRDVIERFHQWAGVGRVVARSKTKPHYKQPWLWSATSKADVRSVVERLLPSMGERRAAKMQEVLDFTDPDWCHRRRHKISEVGTHAKGDHNYCGGCWSDGRDARNASRRALRQSKLTTQSLEAWTE